MRHCSLVDEFLPVPAPRALTSRTACTQMTLFVLSYIGLHEPSEAGFWGAFEGHLETQA